MMGGTNFQFCIQDMNDGMIEVIIPTLLTIKKSMYYFFIPENVDTRDE